MVDRLSPIQANYPVPEDFVVVARRLRSDAIEGMLAFVWRGYDRLRTGDSFCIGEDDIHLEDEISAALCARIEDVIHETDPHFPFRVEHQSHERERAKAMGRLPQCDLAFRIYGGNVRSHFSIETKVIPTQGAVSEYCDEITGNLLTGRYSAFSSEAAMLGYLLSGRPDGTFEAIAKSLQCELVPHSTFKARPHRYSDHRRAKSACRGSSARFRCHHLLMEFPHRAS